MSDYFLVLIAYSRRTRHTHNRSEFRNHQNADASFVKQFLEEWTSYADTLRKQSGESIGVPLEKDDVEAMNDDQIQQLKNLYESATKKKT